MTDLDAKLETVRQILINDLEVVEYTATDAIRCVKEALAGGPLGFEYRIIGNLGFGGKLRIARRLLHDPLLQTVLYVDQYPEHVTPESKALIERVNAKLPVIFGRGGEAETRKQDG